MHPIEAFVRHPVKVAVGVLLVSLFGTLGMLRMPRQLTPEISIPAVQIETRWRGASPFEVEREIVQEQEKQLQSVQGITKMSSECQDSRGRVQLEFQVGTDMQQALVQVNSRLAQVPAYPLEADEPIILVSDASRETLAWFMLTPRLPKTEEIAEFLRKHPEFTNSLEPIRRVSHRNQGLATLMMRRLAACSTKLRAGLPIDLETSVPATDQIRGLAAREPELRDDLKSVLRADRVQRGRKLRELLDRYARLEQLLIDELLPADIDIPKLLHFAENHIEPRFERVPGVSKGETWGGEQIELQVVVDPYKLAARDLTIVDLRTALSRNNTDASAGDFREGKRRWVVRTIGQYRSIQDVEQQIIGVWDGQPVYVRDVIVDGGVRIGFKKPDGRIRRYGEPALAIRGTRTPGSNVLEVTAALTAAAEELNAGLLDQQGLQLTQIEDRSAYIYSALGLVTQNLGFGGVLTIAVLLLFLRSGRSTLIIALAIPTSVVGTFLVLNLLGRSLNVVSLAGLAFAVGMLVDNSVVVLENIHRHWQQGSSGLTAAVAGTKEVWGAVFASTLTTLAVFLPVLFVQQEAGQLFLDIALAISSAVGLSLIVSVTLVPTAAARLLRRDAALTAQTPARTPTSALAKMDALSLRLVNSVVQCNAWTHRSIARQVLVVMLLAGSSIAGTYWLWPKMDYLPTGNRNSIFARFLPPVGYDLSELMAIGDTVESELREYWEVDPDSPAARELRYPVIGDWFFTIRGRELLMSFRAADPTRAWELTPLIRGLGDAIPGTIVTAAQSSVFQRAVNAGRSIDIEITGPRLEHLVDLGQHIMERVPEVVFVDRKTPGGSEHLAAQAHPIPSLDLSNPEVHVLPKHLQAAEMDLDIADLGYTVDALVDGAYATDYYYGGDKIDLTILGQTQLSQRTHDLEGLPVSTGNGRVVPLSALARVHLSSGPEQINRRERQRAITIRVMPPNELALQDAVDRITKQIVAPLQATGRLVDNLHSERYLIRLSGSADKLVETWNALRWNLVLALLITYLLMAALFESWVYPLVIIFSVPLAAAGGILGLYFFNAYRFVLASFSGSQLPPPQTLDVLNMLAFVLLIGTSVNNAILIVHQSLNYMRLDGMDSGEAILRSVRSRIRPIFMTTTTTCCGLAPLVFFPGAGTELYRGLGSILLGGLLMSTVFTLVLVPTLFSLVLALRQHLARLLRRPDAGAVRHLTQRHKDAKVVDDR